MTLRKLSREEESALILELLELPRHFKVYDAAVEFGSSWPELTTAAALLSHCLWWPADKTARSETPPRPIAGTSKLLLRKRMIETTTGRVFCVFTLGGRPVAELTAMRWWLYRGELHPVQSEYKQHLNELVEFYLESKEVARSRMRDLAPHAGGGETVHVGA